MIDKHNFRMWRAGDAGVFQGMWEDWHPWLAELETTNKAVS